MPSYEYQCRVHGEFEVVQSIKDPPLNSCPQCVEDGIAELACSCDGSDQPRLPIPQPIKNAAPAYCLKCGKLMTSCCPVPTRLISATSFQLVGSGWASDNYGSHK